ncbi:MAG: hypothetical protein GVY22_17010 [Gammaproteobacteria bacterium]|jgi:hypothetical protein|nr:hypothetical protein [Gammaproteobacteria bacterium]
MPFDGVYLRAPLELRETREATRFRGTAYSGGVIKHGERLMIDLARTTIENSMPVLLEHDRQSVIGAIESVRNTGSAIEVTGRLFVSADRMAESVAAKLRDGARYQMSVGLFGASTAEIESGTDAEVNGRRLNGPLLILRGGTVREVSIVALGADPGTKAELFSATSYHEAIYAARQAPGHALSAPRSIQDIYDRYQW